MVNHLKTNRGLALAFALVAGLTLITLTDGCGRQQKQAHHERRQVASAVWTMDVKDAQIPYGSLTGEIHGQHFNYERTVFHAGNIKWTSPNKDKSVLILALSKVVADKTFEADPDSSDAPAITIGWHENGQAQTQTFTNGYAMKLKFDPEPAHARKFHGHIYLCFPDDSKSYIAGTFTADLPKHDPTP